MNYNSNPSLFLDELMIIKEMKVKNPYDKIFNLILINKMKYIKLNIIILFN